MSLAFCSKTTTGMSKRQEPQKTGGGRWRERFASLVQSISLTWEERLLVLAVLASLLIGAVTMHWRREYRIDHPIETPRQPVSPATY